MDENKVTLTNENIDQNETSSQTMFCPNCGNPVKEDAKFCTSCGKPLNSENTAAENTQISAEISPAAPKKNNTKKIVIIIVCVLLAVLVIAGAVFGAFQLVKAHAENEIVDEWTATIIEDDGEYKRLDSLKGYMEYKLLLNDDGTGSMYLYTLGKKSSEVYFNWRYTKRTKGFNMFELTVGDEIFGAMNYDEKDDEICFVLLDEEREATFFSR